MAPNQQVPLARHPIRTPKATNPRFVGCPVPVPPKDQILVGTICPSFDPCTLGRMKDGKPYVASVGVVPATEGATVGQVLTTKADDLQPGDYVIGRSRWQEHTVASTHVVRKLSPTDVSISTALGVLGMAGFTALPVCSESASGSAGKRSSFHPPLEPSDTLLGRCRKLRGGHTIGVAGSAVKCRYVVDAYGFDACANYHNDSFPAPLHVACPRGVDVDFENVDGKATDPVLKCINGFDRIIVRGLVSHYNATELPAAPQTICLHS